MKKPTRRTFLATLVSVLAIFPFHAADTRKPNILWLIAENIGPDLGCYGCPLVRTPRLDRLAAEGQLYRLAFDTAPMCSPNSSAFMTGMYAIAIGAQNQH